MDSFKFSVGVDRKQENREMAVDNIAEAERFVC